MQLSVSLTLALRQKSILTFLRITLTYCFCMRGCIGHFYAKQEVIERSGFDPSCYFN